MSQHQLDALGVPYVLVGPVAPVDGQPRPIGVDDRAGVRRAVRGVPAAAAATTKSSTKKARTDRNAVRQRDQTLSR